MKHNRQGFIAWFVRLAVDNEEIQIYGDGQQLRDLCYVDDVCDAFLRAGATHTTDGAVYNLGGLRPIALLELAELIIEIAGSGRLTLIPWPDERKRIDIGDVYSSYEKIKDGLGWEPRTDFDSGLDETVAFYRDNRDWWEPLKDRVRNR